MKGKSIRILGKMKDKPVLTERNGITLFLFPRWEKEGLVGHGFSTRLGGVSQGPFASLNLGLKRGDAPEAVIENRRRFLGIWGKKQEELFCGEQVHGKNVFLLQRDFLKKGHREIPATDALITKEPQLVLGAFSADCLIAFFWDPLRIAIGIAHAGWRGTFKGILAHVIEAMEKEFKSDPEFLEVLMAPSIGPCCYEVGKEVLDTAKLSPWGKEAVFYPGLRPGRFFLDLQKTNINILRKAGVNPSKIITGEFCTCCHRELFYSYRGAKGSRTGSQMGIIFLR